VGTKALEDFPGLRRVLSRISFVRTFVKEARSIASCGGNFIECAIFLRLAPHPFDRERSRRLVLSNRAGANGVTVNPETRAAKSCVASIPIRGEHPSTISKACSLSLRTCAM